jgi:hypothetical protein
MRAAAIATLFAGVCLAQIPERFTTIAGERTGYYWLSLSRGERLIHVIAFRSGYLYSMPSSRAVQDASREACLASLKNPDEKQKAACLVDSFEVKSDAFKEWEGADPQPGGTYGDIVDATNRFFADPENQVMSIVAAWRIARLKQQGRSQAEIDGLMDIFRDKYIRAPRKSCEMGWDVKTFGPLVGITASRCEDLGTTLKLTHPK